jgi:alpha-glucosidase
MPQAVSRTALSWWKGAVIYQIYPRSFLDTDGDGVGDLAGITARLDYVASLGVDAIWLSPFFVSPMKDYGYDVADYTDVDPLFGTLADFDALITRAHDLGLRVIVDMVFAHTSDQHPWFRSSRDVADGPHADWYVWAQPKPDGSPPNNWQSVFGGPGWTWNAARKQYFMHNFLKEQPQLNCREPAVQDALLEAMRFWLERGVDGFRLDAINYAIHDPALLDNPARPADGGMRTRPFDFQIHRHNQSQPEIPAFLQRVRALADSYGEIFLVGEIGGEWAATEMKTYTADDLHLHSVYSFDFLSADRLTPDLVVNTVGQWSGEVGEGWPSWAFSNHDAPRVASRWATRVGQELPPGFSMALLLALRGNAFIYQGEELGLPQAKVPFEDLLDPEAIANWPLGLGRDGARTPLPWRADPPHGGFSTRRPWLPVDPRHLMLAIADQDANETSSLGAVRRLLNLRRAHSALRTGGFHPLAAEAPLLAFDRGDHGPAVRCVFNLGDEPVTSALLEGWRLIYASDTAATPDQIGPMSATWAIPEL